ncbi:unnamed protein product [Lymnaea stagnalis]|uniref:Uncharacterized protein n=1 Tax=Lymnaea stagnalis TaxID=6523 RepID=A0AAV2I6Y5_LYMST
MNITCPTDSPWQTTLPATDIPWLTTREYANCYSLAELDTCTQNFRDGVNAHYPNSGLVCSDVAMFSNCIWRVSCLKTEERYQLILDAKASVNGFNIFCDSIGPDDGGNMSGANLTSSKPIFSHLLVLGLMVVPFLKYN